MRTATSAVRATRMPFEALSWRRGSALRVVGPCLLLLLALLAFPRPARSDTSPGALVSAEAMPGAPEGAQAARVVYWSTSPSGEPVKVSGVIISPAGDPPAGGRPVIAWAHPTTGVISRCAPSLASGFFGSVQGLGEMLRRGFVVAATDYPGLGTPEVHPYLVGESEARAVIDSVRAARGLAGTNAGDRFAVWGHSQGGQAALFTGLIAARYAPDLKLVGVAAAAPATDLATLMSDDMGTSGGNNVTAMTLWSWSRVYGAPLDAVVTAQAEPVVDQLAGLCLESLSDAFSRLGPTEGLKKGFLKVDNLADREPWRRLLAENSPGPVPAHIPVFLAQGASDPLVRPSITEAYRDRLCQAGNRVDFVLLANVGHLMIAHDTAADAVAWMAARFAGEPAPDNCGPR